MVRRKLIGIIMVLLPSIALAQVSGGQVRRPVKKQETTYTPAKNMQMPKKKQTPKKKNPGKIKKESKTNRIH